MAAASDAASAPTRQPGVGTVPGWLWFRADNEQEILSDAASLPEDFEASLQDNAWGPWSSRLLPLLRSAVLEEDGSWTATVKNVATQAETTCKGLHSNTMIPGLEGWLVLDFLQRQQHAPVWSRQLMNGLEKAKRSMPGGRLSAAEYVEGNLLNVSVTGAAVEDSEGKRWDYRRSPLRTWEVPSSGVEGDGYYKVREVKKYLPPWEAWAHPKCRLYQDFYLVEWDAPYDTVDYSATENGPQNGDITPQPGLTWEPDDCLPDSLDYLRISAKRQWVRLQKEKEAKLNVANGVPKALPVPMFVTAYPHAIDEGAGRSRPRPSKAPSSAVNGSSSAPESAQPAVDDGVPQPPQKRQRYNPLQQVLFPDLWQPAISHAWGWQLESDAEHLIKEGWPKSLSEYPNGYGPAWPPGHCFADCTCMEDWHLGRGADRTWINGDQQRCDDAKAAVSSFPDKVGDMRTRGQVTKNWYFEKFNPYLFRTQQEVDNWKIQRVIETAFHSIANKIPVEVLAQEEGSQVFQWLAPVFLANDPDWGPVEAMNYRLETGPVGLQLNPVNGNAILKPGELPFAGEVQIVLQHFTKDNEKMKCTLVRAGEIPYVDDDQKQCSKTVVGLSHGFPEGSLRTIYEERLSILYDFQAHVPLDVPLVVWLRVMSEIFRTARTASVCSVVPRPQAYELRPRDFLKDLGPLDPLP